MNDEEVTNEEKVTVKVSAIKMPLNEKEYARYKYEKARKEMLANPDEEHIKAFEAANKYLFEVEDSYRIGARLLLDRVQNLQGAFIGLLKR